MNVVKNAVEHLNPAQTPVVTFATVCFGQADTVEVARELW